MKNRINPIVYLHMNPDRLAPQIHYKPTKDDMSYNPRNISFDYHYDNEETNHFSTLPL